MEILEDTSCFCPSLSDGRLDKQKNAPLFLLLEFETNNFRLVKYFNKVLIRGINCFRRTMYLKLTLEIRRYEYWRHMQHLQKKRCCSRFEYYSCDISEVSYLADIYSRLILIRHNEFLQLLKMLCFDWIFLFLY